MSKQIANNKDAIDWAHGQGKRKIFFIFRQKEK